MFLIFLLGFVIFGSLIGILCGEGAGELLILVLGVLLVLIMLVYTEISKMNTREGREQNKKELEEEKQIEENFGTIDYFENKKMDK